MPCTIAKPKNTTNTYRYTRVLEYRVLQYLGRCSVLNTRFVYTAHCNIRSSVHAIFFFRAWLLLIRGASTGWVAFAATAAMVFAWLVGAAIRAAAAAAAAAGPSAPPVPVLTAHSTIDEIVAVAKVNPAVHNALRKGKIRGCVMEAIKHLARAAGDGRPAVVAGREVQALDFHFHLREAWIPRSGPLGFTSVVDEEPHAGVRVVMVGATKPVPAAAARGGAKPGAAAAAAAAATPPLEFRKGDIILAVNAQSIVGHPKGTFETLRKQTPTTAGAGPGAEVHLVLLRFGKPPVVGSTKPPPSTNMTPHFKCNLTHCHLFYAPSCDGPNVSPLKVSQGHWFPVAVPRGAALSADKPDWLPLQYVMLLFVVGDCMSAFLVRSSCKNVVSYFPTHIPVLYANGLRRSPFVRWPYAATLACVHTRPSVCAPSNDPARHQ